MKTKLATLPLAAFAIISCAKEPAAVNTANTTGNEIVFLAESPYEGTKAYVEAGSKSLEDGGFKVAGIAPGSSSSFFNEKASWDASSSSFKTVGTYFHPSGGNASFSAAYPSTLTISVSSGKASLNYSSVVTDDVMAAYTVPTQTDKAVSLSFNHILSQVCVKAKAGDSRFTYKVKSVKLTGKASGVFDFETASWSSAEGSKDATYFSGEQQITATEYNSFGSDNMAFIPKGAQTGGQSSLTITMEYQIFLDGTIISDFTGVKARSVAVNLEQGKRCVVNCTLPTGEIAPITFTVSVVPWADAQAQNVEI